MRVYYFLYSLDEAEFEFFTERTWMIRSASDIHKVLDDYFFRIGVPKQGRTTSSAFLEAMMFLEHFLECKLGSIDDIRWLYAQNFLILNESLYEFRNGTYTEVEDDVIFVTTRDTWRNPFFIYIDRFLSGKVRLLKPNLDYQTNQADKLNSIAKLWEDRAAYIGDIIIPHLRNKHVDHVQILLNFAQANIGDRLVIKNNYGVEGKRVRGINLNIPHFAVPEMAQVLQRQYFDGGVRGANNSYIVREYSIQKEFRVYFTCSRSDGIKIFSVKNRENIPKAGKGRLGRCDFSRDSLDVVWHYQHPDDFRRQDGDAVDFCTKIIPLLKAEVGVLEVCRETDGNLRFLEINHLGGALMHSGPDEQLMRDYYRTMWKGLLGEQ